MITENQKIIDLILIEKTAYERWQKNEKQIVMKSHEQSEHVAKNLKKHKNAPSVTQFFNLKLDSDAGKKINLPSAVSVEILEVTSGQVNTGEGKGVSGISSLKILNRC